MTDTEKMMRTNIKGNFVADNIVFKVRKIGPVSISRRYGQKSGQNNRNIIGHANILRNNIFFLFGDFLHNYSLL